MKRKLDKGASRGQSPAKLIKSVKTGNIAEAKRLILEMSDQEISITNKFNSTALHEAAKQGHKEVCELLINKMSPEAVNATNKNCKTALHEAAKQGHKEVCELLINKMSPEAINAVVTGYADFGKTALHFAASQGHKEICELLINKMSPEAINAVIIDYTDCGKTALHFAAEGGHKETCKILIENMYTKQIAALLNKSGKGSPIQKVVIEIVADFMKDKFSSSENNSVVFDDCQTRLLKLHQVVDQDLLKSLLGKEGNSSLYISNANNYITQYYFKLIGVCKFLTNSPISILVSSDDCMSHMLSYLAPHSLFPKLFAPVSIELSGEDIGENP
jgi:ankyrin repeat protein